jgi:hypothetical protein
MLKTIRQYILRKPSDRSTIDAAFLATMTIALLALFALIFYQLRPIPTVDIKVPVATDKAEYYAGQEVSGIFFGDIYYKGRVEILREVFCKDYRGVIKTDEGDDIFKGISAPQHLEGTSRRIGLLPADVPVGSNCVIQFLNTYNIETPFGNRQIVRDYYTQNFKIVDKPAPAEQAEDVSHEGQEDTLFPPREQSEPAKPVTPEKAPEPQKAQNEPPAEPVVPPEVCSVKLLFICVKL